ncbi:hypothetical protein Tco_0721791, partial [Tanacetum coccineum]
MCKNWARPKAVNLSRRPWEVLRLPIAGR